MVRNSLPDHSPSNLWTANSVVPNDQNESSPTTPMTSRQEAMVPEFPSESTFPNNFTAQLDDFQSWRHQRAHSSIQSWPESATGTEVPFDYINFGSAMEYLPRQWPVHAFDWNDYLTHRDIELPPFSVFGFEARYFESHADSFSSLQPQEDL